MHYDRGELLPGAMGIKPEYEGVVSAAADICHALNYLQDVNGTPWTTWAKSWSTGYDRDMLTMKYLGIKSVPETTPTIKSYTFEKRLSGGDEVGVILGANHDEYGNWKPFESHIQYLALVGGGNVCFGPLKRAICLMRICWTFTVNCKNFSSTKRGLSWRTVFRFGEHWWTLQGAIFGQGLGFRQRRKWRGRHHIFYHRFRRLVFAQWGAKDDITELVTQGNIKELR